jgi:hypothetical protein
MKRILDVMQVALPEHWAEHKPILERITNSARLRTVAIP